MKTGTKGVAIRQVKRRLERGFFGSKTNLVGGRSSADQKGYRINEKRFSGPRFSRENGKTTLKPQAELFQNREIDDAQLGKHGCELADALCSPRVLGQQ